MTGLVKRLLWTGRPQGSPLQRRESACIPFHDSDPSDWL